MRFDMITRTESDATEVTKRSCYCRDPAHSITCVQWKHTSVAKYKPWSVIWKPDNYPSLIFLRVPDSSKDPYDVIWC